MRPAPAQGLATRILNSEGDIAAKLNFGFRLCTARKPNENELTVLTELLKSERNRQDEAKAWVAVARVLLNLDETVTKE